MKTYDFVHLVLWALGGEVQGKTKLQKNIYFIGRLTNTLDDLGFQPHYYGPYSENITYAVERLKALNFLSQSAVGAGNHDYRGFEISRQDFKLTDEGETIARQKIHKYPKEWKAIQKAVKAIQRAGDLDYMKMSIAAKTYYLKNENQTASAKELSEKAKELGWKPTPEEIKESIGFLKKLKLVK